ncbi:hypothetical protein K9N08_04165 [Candidatus Gracilibacteria bacterium]|nr:hypothetical protein [Candidatus Gracilibacteria bacterium]MCF7856709.1 hypothetical protein [Candidatus Gracilibacteria bacterium]MCF7897015.1 hypothetical protein [Candidatus Gracilibacteria bacterium]
MLEKIRHRFSSEGKLENAAGKMPPCENASDLFKDLLDEKKIIKLISKHFREELKAILGKEGKPKGWDWDDIAVELLTNPSLQEKCENSEGFKEKIALIAKAQSRNVGDLNKLLEELKELAQKRWERIKKVINTDGFNESRFIKEMAWKIDERYPLVFDKKDLEEKGIMKKMGSN